MSSQVLAMPQSMQDERQARWDAVWLWATLAFLLLGATGYWIWRATAERRAIESLGPAERSALFERTEANLRTTCVAPPEPMVAFCQQQAAFILEFPECDAACRALAREQRARTEATR